MSDPISITDIRAAAARLQGIAHRTPVGTSRTLNQITGREIYLKCENMQRIGAFKFRGAYNTISQLSPEQLERGVMAFSSGNHAQGVALAAKLLGTTAVICMPSDAPASKIAATREYGAEVVLYDRATQDREEVATKIAQERGLSMVPPFDNLNIMAGAGTAALELLEEVPDLDTLVVPIGGGGLISGSCIAAHGINPNINIIGVEPADGNDTQLSLAAGEQITVPAPQSIADGLRTPRPGKLTFPVVQRHVSQIIIVSDDEIRDALRFAIQRLKMVIEPSGAVPLAAALAQQLPADAKRVGMIISGGNVDFDVLGQL
jgi:threonine dehydratase